MTERVALRREDRRVADEAWIREMLRRSPVGVLATATNCQPFLNSNLFAYDEASDAIYLHTGRRGRTRGNVETNPLVCFHVFEMGRLLPAATALEFSAEYASVTVFGRGGLVTDPVEGRHGLGMILAKYAPHLEPGRDYRGITCAELRRTSVFRIDIEEWSGKRKQADPDFPGAFVYPHAPTDR